jgi:GNAT superfamily N-acetyltransferase
MGSNKRTLKFDLRPLRSEDADEHGELLFSSFNAWWWKHGLGRDFYDCTPQDTRIFFEIYSEISPGCSIGAFHKETGKMMGACFYHPRENHVSLGIMSVHPNYSGYGAARAMVNYILDYTKSHGFKSCRLVNSTMNLDSFSLYNKAGFIPRESYQDMVVNVPEGGISETVPGMDRVRAAQLKDIEGMGILEREISGICRESDYRYAIENPRGVMQTLVSKNKGGELEGFLISLRTPALNILGPCLARDEETALALLRTGLDWFTGLPALFVVPMRKRKIVEQLYAWKAFNVETHIKQVWGEFKSYSGVSMPSFLPETE